jgi:hypothetical protein
MKTGRTARRRQRGVADRRGQQQRRIIISIGNPLRANVVGRYTTSHKLNMRPAIRWRLLGYRHRPISQAVVG